ncbi:MAG: hypothetical protein ABI112_02500 [Terracoccus sp.]
MTNETIGSGARPRWSAKRSAITAGLALLLTSAGAIGAAAALPSGSTDVDTGRIGGGRMGWDTQQNGVAGNGSSGLGPRHNGGHLPDQLGGTRPDPNQPGLTQQDPNQQDPNQQDPSSPDQPTVPNSGTGSGVLNT